MLFRFFPAIRNNFFPSCSNLLLYFFLFFPFLPFQVKRIPLGRSLEGKVMDERGNSLSGVRVDAWGAGRKLLASVKTGEGGEFSLFFPRQAEPLLLFFSTPGYLPKRVDLKNTKRDGDKTTVVLKKGRGGRVFLFRISGGGPWTGMARAWVFGVLWAPPGWGPLAKADPLAPPQEAVSTGEGEFHFSLPSTPLVALLVLPEGGTLKTRIFPGKAFLSGGPRIGVETRPGLRVHLLDPLGNPLPGRELEVVLVPPWKDRILRAAAPFIWPKARTFPRRGWRSWWKERLGLQRIYEPPFVPWMGAKKFGGSFSTRFFCGKRSPRGNGGSRFPWARRSRGAGGSLLAADSSGFPGMGNLFPKEFSMPARPFPLSGERSKRGGGGENQPISPSKGPMGTGFSRWIRMEKSNRWRFRGGGIPFYGGGAIPSLS